MMQRFQWIVVPMLALLVQPNYVCAWNSSGHKTIASIAFLQLSPREQQIITAMLRHHPRYAEDFERQMPEDVENVNEWMFQQAAIWPDLAKTLPEALKSKYDHPSWHYICKPVFLDAESQRALESNLSINLKLDPPKKPTRDMNVVQMIRLARRMLLDNSSCQEDKALFLAWLIHDVGEIHQPLNTAVLYSNKLFPEGDRGPNLIMTKRHGNLRNFWDGLLGSFSKFRDLHDKAVALMSNSLSKESDDAAALTLDEEIWLDESYACAEHICYLIEVRNQLKLDSSTGKVARIQLSEDYYVGLSRQNANMYAIAAGRRLGAILKEVAAK